MVLSQFRKLCAVPITAIVLSIAAGGPSVAQELYGSIVGTVQDGSGGRIPGASVEIVNRETIVRTGRIHSNRRPARARRAH